MKAFKRPGALEVAVMLLLLAVLLLLGHEALLLLVSIGLAYFILDRCLSAIIFDSIFYRLIMSVVFYVAVLQAVIISAWLFYHNFPLNYSLGVSFVLLAVSAGASYVLKSEGAAASSKGLGAFNHADLVSALVGLLIVVLVLFAPFVRSGAYSRHADFRAAAVDYVNTSLDDSSHLGNLNDRLQLNRGVLFGTNVTKEVVHAAAVSSYPAGWHAANAVLIKSLDPGVRVGGQSLMAYVATKVFWLFVLVYSFSRVIFCLYYAFLNKPRKYILPEHVWLTGSVLFLSYYMLLEQFREGFYIFIPVLIANVLCVPLLMQLGMEKPTAAGRYLAVLPLVLLMVSAALSWTLLIPAIIFTLCVVVLDSLRPKEIYASLVALCRQLLANLHLLIIAALAVLVQLHVLTAGSSRSFRAAVDDPGSITMHSPWYFAFAILGVLLFYSIRLKPARAVEGISSFLVTLLGIAFFVYSFQMITIHRPEYYYIKSLNTVLIIAVPLAILGFLRLVRGITLGQGQFNAAIISLGFVILLPLTIGIDPLNTSNLSYIKGRHGFTKAENEFIYDSLTSRSKTALNQRSQDVIFYSPGMTAHNIVGTNILRSIQPVDPCDSKIFNALNLDEKTLLNTVASCQKAPLTIVTKSAYSQELQNNIKATHLDRVVAVKVTGD